MYLTLNLLYLYKFFFHLYIWIECGPFIPVFAINTTILFLNFDVHRKTSGSWEIIKSQEKIATSRWKVSISINIRMFGISKELISCDQIPYQEDRKRDSNSCYKIGFIKSI